MEILSGMPKGFECFSPKICDIEKIVFKVAPYGFFKSEKMQVSTSKTAYGYFGKE